MKVAIIDGDFNYTSLFVKMGYDVVASPEDAQLICFTGGEDVSPSLYNEPSHPTTFSNIIRDQKETKIFLEAIKAGKPMVGICRGAQFLNVMCGGTMYQNVSDHLGSHNIYDDETREVILVTSTHHQMMKPGADSVLIAFGGQMGTATYWNNGSWETEVLPLDNEVVVYPNRNVLCFQPHPEYYLNSKEFSGMYDYFSKLVDRLTTGHYKPL